MHVDIYQGHVLEQLARIPDRSVHMVWTSPPYWGLRAYGTEPQIWEAREGCKHLWLDCIPGEQTRGGRGASSQSADRSVSDAQGEGRRAGRGQWCFDCGAWRGEHGLEPTLMMWLKNEVAIFREVRRALRDDGTLWLNVGDAYATHPNGRAASDVKAMGSDDRTFRDKPLMNNGLPEKNRLGLPHRLVFALQDDGWYWRDEIVWSKPNPMPSSVKDRTTPAHEFVFLLSKKPHYYFDAVAISEPAAYGEPNSPQSIKSPYGHGYSRRAKPTNWAPQDVVHGPIELSAKRSGNLARKPPAARGRADDGTNVAGSVPWEGFTRNKRSVWSIATEPFPEAHFATAPTELVRLCIQAGTSAQGCCPICGAPYKRVVRRVGIKQPDAPNSAERTEAQTGPNSGWAGSERTVQAVQTMGWIAGCKQPCAGGPAVAPVVLDPFGGSGTTAVVALQLQRDAALIELQPEYVKLARARLRRDLGMLAKVTLK